MLASHNMISVMAKRSYDGMMQSVYKPMDCGTGGGRGRGRPDGEERGNV